MKSRFSTYWVLNKTASNLQFWICVTLLLLFYSCASDQNGQEQDAINIDSISSNTLDSNSFTSKLIQGKNFEVKVNTEKKGELLDINLDLQFKTAQRIQKSYQLDGDLKFSQLADLNQNGLEEIYLFYTSAGSGGYGQIIGYELNQGKLDSIIIENLPNDIEQQYMGHDSFAIRDRSLWRTFPLYLPMDANCCPSGGQYANDYILIKENGRLLLKSVNE